MRIIITEFKRMFCEKKLTGMIVITLAYVTLCSMFWNLRFKLDYGYTDVYYNVSGFKLWQDVLGKGYMQMLLNIVPPLVYVLSFSEDRKENLDGRICVQTGGTLYYTSKYITSIAAGMLYNFMLVTLSYFPLYFFLSTGNYGWDYLDRTEALLSDSFKGDSAMDVVLLCGLGYAFVGGVCAAMAFVISIWIDNKVLICVMPYIVFSILTPIAGGAFSPELAHVIYGYVDDSFTYPFSESVCYFLFWMSLLGIAFLGSYIIRIERKR